MSRLDSFIRRLEAQRACIDAAVEAIAKVPGVVFEFGLGNGRTYDHLREALPNRRIIVFERDPQPHPECWPAQEDLMVGSLDVTLPAATAHWSGQVALVHSDIGTGDATRNLRVAADLAARLPALLSPGGFVVSDQQLVDPMLEPLPEPANVAVGRYFLYRRIRTSMEPQH